jgi:hypothetical protein
MTEIRHTDPIKRIVERISLAPDARDLSSLGLGPLDEQASPGHIALTTHEYHGLIKTALALTSPHPLYTFGLKAKMLENRRQYLVTWKRVIEKLAISDYICQPGRRSANLRNLTGVDVHIIEVLRNVVGH